MATSGFSKAVDCPASKNDLLKNARRERADEYGRVRSERMPDNEDASSVAVNQAPGTIG